MNLDLLPSKETLILSCDWIKNQVEEKEFILPFRRFKGYMSRGKIYTFNDRDFLSVDNEALTAVYDDLNNYINSCKSYSELILNKKIIMSFRTDNELIKEKKLFKHGIVKTKLREHGLKLAHLIDSGRSENKKESEVTFIVRFLKSMHPINIIPFPNSKHINFKDINFKNTRNDLAEDPLIQGLLLSFLNEYIGKHYMLDYLELINVDSSIIIQDWREIAEKLKFTTCPKTKSNSNKREIEKSKIKRKENYNKMETIIRRNFYLSQEYYGRGLVIAVRELGFYYNHDEIIDAVYNSRFAPGCPAHTSWENYGYYTKTNGFPGWANEFIEEL